VSGDRTARVDFPSRAGKVRADVDISTPSNTERTVVT
jgi:hypothetical protein